MRADALRDLLEHGVARLPRGRLDPAPGALDGDPGAQGLVGAEAGHLGDDPLRVVGGAVLERVVDDGTDHPDADLGRLEDRGGQQGEAVGAARAGHHDHAPVDGQDLADGQPDGGDRRVEGHRRRSGRGGGELVTECRRETVTGSPPTRIDLVTARG